MDDELRQAFATLSAQISDVGSDARNAAAVAREAKHETIALSRRFDGIEQDVGHLKSAVFGSNPPPSPTPAVVKRITHTEGDIAELAGQVIAVKALNEEQSKEIVTIKEQLVTAAQERASTAEDVKAIKDAVVGVVTNPKVRLVGKVIFGFAMTYAVARGYLKELP